MPLGFSNFDLGNFSPVEKFSDDTESGTADSDFEISSKLLHPLSFPKSMGISFVLDGTKTKFNFCATFSRYFKSGNVWKRKATVFIQKNASAAKKKDEWAIDDAVKIKLLSNQMPDGNYHVSLFLVNNIQAEKRIRILTDSYIFQPQLRINLESYDSLHPVRSSKPSMKDKEEQQLDLLYRDQKALARGHMTGAVWQEIDPERPLKGRSVKNIIPDDLSEKVFVENGFSKNDLDEFINPHLRTDYLPSYSINQSTVSISNIPDMVDDDGDAELLSQGYGSDKMFESLEKLKNAYGDWIKNQDISSLEPDKKIIAQRNLDDCEFAKQRITKGIEILRNDNVRLAFCFMNKAMALQTTWKGRSKLVWRPFQLGFILQCLDGIVNPDTDDRKICDLLWYPTAGGKTEAYLGILVFTLALRRLIGDRDNSSCYGTAAISRYTLRLLTIQQFRRSVSVITACEYLRTTDWRPTSADKDKGKKIWGTRSFSAGLWVGGGLTPNTLVDMSSLGYDRVSKKSVRYVGAISILRYQHLPKKGEAVETSFNDEEPAQILECPCCQKILAVPKSGFHGENHELFLTVSSASKPVLHHSDLNFDDITVTEDPTIHQLPKNGTYVIQIKFSAVLSSASDNKMNNWWFYCIKKKIPEAKIECSSPSRPGYFIKTEPIKSDSPYSSNYPFDVEIRCPNPECPLNKIKWDESIFTLDGNEIFTKVASPFQDGNTNVSHGMPIPAYVVDSQIYTKCPSLIVATVDKFAQLPILPDTASMFGNVNSYDDVWGFYRQGISPDYGPLGCPGKIYRVKPFLPPEIILQDELHLIEGPLGSMVGLYETAVDILCTRKINGKNIGPKYLVSTATIRAAGDQIQSLYCKEFKQFPPHGIVVGKNFFSDATEAHPLDDSGPGRWYVGVMSPGKGPITPVTRIWASLLLNAELIRQQNGGQITDDLKYFWTVVGYFNAMRELAGIRSAYNQDIPSWVNTIAMRSGITTRVLSQLQLIELHSNIPDKTNVSSILERLEKENSDAVLATSMFGTGVDVDRLSLMIVHGQPKTTSSYIQATGRVGRKKGALVVTFLRSTRSRDLDHYEFFTGYHRSLYRYVEPITVFPFSPGAVNKGILPVFVSILRNGLSVNGITISPNWAFEDMFGAHTSSSRKMATDRNISKEIDEIVSLIKKRNSDQPEDRTQPEKDVTGRLISLISSWEVLSKKAKDLFYRESAYGRAPKYPVVLGDDQHTEANITVVNQNTPNSLRDVESTTRFRD